MHSILRPLQEQYDIHYIGIGYRDVIKDDGITFYPANPNHNDIWGALQGKAFVETRQPDIVFLLNDHQFLRSYLVHEPYKTKTKVVAYMPLDGTITESRSFAHMNGIAQIVAYNEFGCKEFQRVGTYLEQASDEFVCPPIKAIPHGVDTERFYPLSGSVPDHSCAVRRRTARQALFPDDPQWQDAFIVLNANMAQPRKRIDLTIEGFARFAQDKPANVKLYLHHAILRDKEYQELLELAQQHGIADRLNLVPIAEHGERGFSDEALNLLYNACDVGLNTSLGEGWGMISFEHGATGAAQIVPNHSACAELWPGAAELVDPVESVQLRGFPQQMAAVSAEGVAEALERLYHDPDYRQQMARAAYQLATQPQFSWANIADQWDQLFQEVLNR
ncbi:MAG: glycosyltransferase family 4 protein [Chloroflexota bacterium]